MKKIFISCFLLMVLFFVSSCDNKTETNSPENEEHHDEHESASTTTLSTEQMKSIDVQFGTLEKKQLTSSLKANGFLKVPNQNRSSATALMGGIIKSLYVQSGTFVSKGQLIATISNTSFISLQEEYLTTVSKTKLAELDYARQQELQEGNAGALKTLQQAESELNILKAKKSSLQKQLELIGINTNTLSAENMQSVLEIRSPISGTVSTVLGNIGTFIDVNNPVAEIIDNSQLHLDLFVYERDLSKLKVGQTIHFTLTNNPGKEYDAKIYAVSNTFEENSKAIAVHATVEGDKQGLIDGMSITALVSLENALLEAVPNSAIVNYQNADYIFIVSENHHEEEHAHENESAHEEETSQETSFEKIPVRTGTSDIGYTEITLLKDVPANALIVTKGAFFILAKMTNTGEHEH